MLMQSTVILLLAATTGSVVSARHQAPENIQPTKHDAARPAQPDSNAGQPPGDSVKPITVVVQPPAEDPKAKAEEHHQREREIAATERAVRFNEWLALIGLGTGLVVGWQAWETRKAANSAERSASVAEKTAILAERSMVLLNRAYVDVADWTLASVDPDVPMKIPLYFFIRFGITTASPTPAVIDSVELISPTAAIQGGPVGVMVSQRFVLSHTLTLGPLTKEQQERLLKPGEAIRVEVVGRIRYRDIFNKPRSRSFARVFTYYARGSAINHQFVIPDDPTMNTEDNWGNTWGQHQEHQPQVSNAALSYPE
jgi:hypothetical protein